jgi:hypothetical protein
VPFAGLPLPRVQLVLTMGYKFCTISFKDRIELGSGSITSHFLTIIYLGP